MGWISDNVGDLAELYFKNEQAKNDRLALTNQRAYDSLAMADTNTTLRPGVTPMTEVEAGYLNQQNPIIGVSNGAALLAAAALAVALLVLRK